MSQDTSVSWNLSYSWCYIIKDIFFFYLKKKKNLFWLPYKHFSKSVTHNIELVITLGTFLFLACCQ